MTDAPENSENSQDIPENSEQIQALPVPKRGRGRPKGALDSAPRKRRIIEEPLLPIKEVAEPPKPIPTPAPVEPVRIKTRRAPVRVESAMAVQEPVAPAPPSPMTLFRQAGETIYQLQAQRENARRDYWAQAIHRSLR